MLSQILTEDCFMLDIETTGLSSRNNAMTSFALVRFNLSGVGLDNCILDWAHYSINSAINTDLILINNPATMEFRTKHGIDNAELLLPRINSLQDIPETINEYLKQSKLENRNLFALHTEFDVSFLKGYYEEAGFEFPFKHRKIWELSSLIAGLDQDFKTIRDDVDHFKVVETIGGMRKIDNFVPHNALYDCFRQIEFLRRAAWQAGILA